MIEPRIQAFDIIYEISPPISTLGVDELVDETRRSAPGTARRWLLVGILVSLLIHLMVVLIMVKVVRHRAISVAEEPRVSVQIRITGPRPTTAGTPASAPPLPDTGAAPLAESEPSTTTSTETDSSPTIALDPITIPPVTDETASSNEASASPRAPSTMDIRQTVRSLNTANNRQPDCTPWMRRNDMFALCEPDVDQADYEEVSRTATLTPLIPREPPVEPALPADATDSRQRLQSLFDRVDDRLGTSRTRRAIMQPP